MNDVVVRLGIGPDEQESGAGESSATDGGLFVVRIRESCCEPLVGHGAVGYASPPQPLPAARSLVALLSGRGHVDEIAPGEFTVAVAGGQRTITLEAVR